MRAARMLERNGTPVLQRVPEIDVPKGACRIEVLAAGLQRGDLMRAQGTYKVPELPLCGPRMVIASMRSVARAVGAGKLPRENDAWFNKPSSAWVARQLGLDPVVIGPDFRAFTTALFKRQ